MKKIFSAVVLLALTISFTFFTSPVSQVSADESKVLEFNTMIGVPRPFTRNNGNAIRGIDGGGLPWVISFGKGELNPSGIIDLKVKGLVFDPNDPGTIAAGVAGRNTVPFFKAIVSCLSKDASDNMIIVNLSTATFPADEFGNAHIKDRVSLPTPCIAPIIFVTSPTGLWFASTGF